MGGGDIATVSPARRQHRRPVRRRRRARRRFVSAHSPRRGDTKISARCSTRKRTHIDAVTVGTPDHIHAVASMAAIRAGKHVYCQKPLTHTLHRMPRADQGRARRPASPPRWATRGTPPKGPGSPTNGSRPASSATVREVHVWSDRAGRLWKQGIGRPTETPPVPSTLDWNLWLGPVRERPYNPAYAPVSWRGWWDFGTGALGDMGCHIIDHPVWALQLGPPSVRRGPHDASTARSSTATSRTSRPIRSPRSSTYEFPARGDLPPVRMTWYDGGLMPPAPAELPAGRALARQRRALRRQQGEDVPRLSRRHAPAPAARPSRRGRQGPQDDGTLARPLRRMGGRLQGRPAPGLELRLRRPADRDRAPGRARPQGTRVDGWSGTARTSRSRTPRS